jgi:ligand-binding sensor domain-containing protein
MCTATNHFFHTVDVKDGMADNYVRNITRDSYGYIWISTINGLSRYDGHRFRQFMPLLYGGNSNDIQAVRETADSTLWMVSSGELFTYTRRDESWRKDGIDKLAALRIEGRMKLFYVDDRNNLWVVTEEGLFHYDYAQHALIRIANYSGIPILHIVSKEGTTIIVTEDYKIYNVFLKERRLVQIGQTSPTPYNRDSRV